MWQHLLEEWQRNPVGGKDAYGVLIMLVRIQSPSPSWCQHPSFFPHANSSFRYFLIRLCRIQPQRIPFFFCSTRENSWPSPKPKTVESIWLVLLIITNHLPESTMVNSRKWSLSLVPRRHLSLEYGSSSRLLLHFWKSTNWLALEQSQLMKSISRVYAAGIRGFTIGPIKHVVLPSNAFALQETRQKSVGQKPTFLLK